MNLVTLFSRPIGMIFALVVLLSVLLGLLWWLNPAASQENVAVTRPSTTIVARLTEALLATRSGGGNPGWTPIATTATLVVSSPTATPSRTDRTLVSPDHFLEATPSSTLSCDRAAPGIPMDITVPDETQYRPGENFTKIWRLQNIGTCIWTADYAARFFYGDLMGASEVVYMGREIFPGDNVDIAVDMQSPDEPGNYQGNWKLMNTNGQLFGIGPKGDAPFWVRIRVIRVATQTSTPTVSPTPTSTSTLPATATATSTATPPVKSSGDLMLGIGDLVDLDTGTTNPLQGEDLTYQLENSFHLLIPQDEADLGIYGAGQPGLEICQASALSKAPIALESLSLDIYLCFRTDSGRYGWLRYISLENDGLAKLAYHTWANP